MLFSEEYIYIWDLVLGVLGPMPAAQGPNWKQNENEKHIYLPAQVNSSRRYENVKDTMKHTYRDYIIAHQFSNGI